MISLCALVQMHQKKRRSNNSNSTSMTAGHPDLASVTNTYDSLFGKTDLLASSSLSLSSPLLLTSLPSILLPLPSRGKSARGVCGSLWEIEREREGERVDVRRDRFAVVAQAYETRVSDEFVIRGNAAILKCSIPSFVADFVTVQAWVTNDGKAYYPTDKHGIFVVGVKDAACNVASFLFV